MDSKSQRAVLSGQIPVRAKGSSKCATHMNKDVVLVCNDCQDLICITCSLSQHRLHDVVELADVLPAKKALLQDFINDTESQTIPRLQLDVEGTNKKLTNNEISFKQLTEDTRRQGQKCKDDIDVLVDEFTAMYDEMEKANRELLQSHLAVLRENINTLTEQTTRCKDCLQSGIHVDIHDTLSEIKSNGDLPTEPKLQKAEFSPSKFNTDHLKSAMGMLTTSHEYRMAQTPTGSRDHSLQEAELNQQEFRQSDDEVSAFIHPSEVTAICPTPDGSAWVCGYSSDTIMLIDGKGRVKLEAKYHCDIQDLSLMPGTDRLFFCCWEEKSVNEFSPSTKTFVKKFQTQDKPGSLCATKDGRIVVASWYRVTIFTTGGDILHTTTKDKSGISGPGQIVQCPKTGKIAIVTSERVSNKWVRHIIIFNESLMVVLKYKGAGIMVDQEEIPPESFGPRSLAYDSNGNLIIADDSRQTIELISGSGKFIKTLQKRQEREGQGRIALQKQEILWTQSGNAIKVLKYGTC